MSWKSDFEADLAKQTRSGPHPITEEHKLKNREVCALIEDIMPIADIHKINDVDLIYRFLIAKKWDVKLSADAIRAYVKWRADNKIDELLWETFPEDTSALACVYKGFDREGHPVYFDNPDPKVLGQILTAYTREQLMRVHIQSMEVGRRLQKMYGVDRVTCVIDVAQLSMSIVANPSAIMFMKSLAHEDQTMYPENMRFMLICNGGWTFSSAYKMIKPVLDPRVQMKIHFMGGKDAMYSDLDKFIDKANLPEAFKGTLTSGPLLDLEELSALYPKGSAPAALSSPLAAPAHKSAADFLIDDSQFPHSPPGAPPGSNDDEICDDDL